MADTEELEVLVEEDTPESETVINPDAPKEGAEAALATDRDESDSERRDRIRQERRERRDKQRAAREHKDRLIETLQREKDELAQRVAQIERNTASTQAASLDQQLHDMAARYAQAKAAHEKAVAESDGSGAANAIEAMFTSKQEWDRLNGLKAAHPQQQTDQRQAERQAAIKRRAAEWTARNDWLDTEATEDERAIVAQIDKAVMSAGYDPTTPAYWEQMDARIAKQLPHFADDGDEPAPKPEPEPRKPAGGPPVAGAGRSATSNGATKKLVISGDRARELRRNGINLDDPDTKLKWAKHFAKWDRENPQTNRA